MQKVVSIRQHIYLMKMIASLCLLILLTTTSLLAQDSPVFSTLEHDGHTRTYTLHTPANLEGDKKRPLVIVLHAASSSGKAMQAITGFDAEADANGFFVAYPDSQEVIWDDYRSTGLKDIEPVDDVGFLQALITELADEYPIDPAQVHLVGIANGGSFALRAACEASATFASFTIVSAQMWDYQAEHCPEVGVVKPMLFVHGIADTLYAVEGKYFPDTPQHITSLNETIDFWRDRYGCAMPQDVTSETILFEYGDCRGGGLSLYSVPKAGGAWYRGENDLVNPGGPDYTRLISAFIRRDNWRKEIKLSTISGYQRTYTLYVPPNYTGETSVPLVMLLHGRSGTGAGMAQISQMNAIAERDNFIVVYPDGLQNQWNYGRDWPFYSQADDINDDDFFATLLLSLAQNLNLDATKRYVSSFSNGGFMTQRLACTMPDTFAAFASVGATGPYGLTQGCANINDPIPMMFIHGTADPSVPWLGTPLQVEGHTVYTTAPMDNTLAFWVNHNGCAVDVDNETLPKANETEPTETLVLTFQGCPTDAPLILYAVKEGGHRWHGTDTNLDDAGLGQSSQDFKASEVIWAFFQQFSLETDN